MSSMIRRRDDAPFFKKKREFPARSGNGKGFPIGPRTKERQAANKDLNKLPREITHRCELRVEGVCIGDRMLQWCHPTKSRFIVTKAQWREAARGCAACHDYYDHHGSHAKMAKAIRDAIAKRKPPFNESFQTPTKPT